MSKYNDIETGTKSALNEAFKNIIYTIQANTSSAKQLALSVEQDKKAIVDEREAFKAQIAELQAVTKEAVFNINNMTVTLKKGDTKKGFVHILLKHFCNNCDGEITARDIINMDMIIARGIKLNRTGVSNHSLHVYQYLKGNKHHKIVLKPDVNNNFVVTMYSVG
ncbi:MAG: hypothetical protein U9N42_07765 [Campylobacterota bacterium]|nr:hypothetical protein [Campylobacterota bacterium]